MNAAQMNNRVEVSIDGDIGTVCLNKPERGNAIDNQMAREVTTAINRFVEDDIVRAVVVRSNGAHFCTGADISDNKRDKNTPRPKVGHMLRSLGSAPHAMIEAVWNCPLPTVAEVTGRASGLGLHLALACDFAVCARSATFAEPFIERGFSVDSGGSWLLQRAVGMRRAKQLLLLTDPVDSTTALEWGLVSEVTPDDQVAIRCNDLARVLAAKSTFAVGITKSLLNQATESTLAEALEREAHGVEITIRSDDFKEGMRAFREKRKPKFEGR